MFFLYAAPLCNEQLILENKAEADSLPVRRGSADAAVPSPTRSGLRSQDEAHISRDYLRVTVQSRASSSSAYTRSGWAFYAKPA